MRSRCLQQATRGHYGALSRTMRRASPGSLKGPARTHSYQWQQQRSFAASRSPGCQRQGRVAAGATRLLGPHPTRARPVGVRACAMRPPNKAHAPALASRRVQTGHQRARVGFAEIGVCMNECGTQGRPAIIHPCISSRAANQFNPAAPAPPPPRRHARSLFPPPPRPPPCAGLLPRTASLTSCWPCPPCHQGSHSSPLPPRPAFFLRVRVLYVCLGFCPHTNSYT